MNHRFTTLKGFQLRHHLAQILNLLGGRREIRADGGGLDVTGGCEFVSLLLSLVIGCIMLSGQCLGVGIKRAMNRIDWPKMQVFVDVRKKKIQDPQLLNSGGRGCAGIMRFGAHTRTAFGNDRLPGRELECLETGLGTRG